jgi:hypothetical protein
MSTPMITATRDTRLSAVVQRTTPLYYSDGADQELDRPAHVRAASAIVRAASYTIVIQDDANFVALIDPQGTLRGLALPPGGDGLRQFDDERGNKALKLDLEACAVIPSPDGAAVIAFGSGSSPHRERVALLDGFEQFAPRYALSEAHDLYSLLRAMHEFSGSELNIEGAVFQAGSIMLLNRGNGAPIADRQPVNASCIIPVVALVDYLDDPINHPPPLPTTIVQYDLGSIGLCPLTFTDATPCPGGVLYAATAEQSPDAVRDGPVLGSALGVLMGNTARWIELTNPDGSYFTAKVEGLLLDETNPHQVTLVIDRDTPSLPAELCLATLSGPWF